MKWYAVHTYSGYEEKVKESLKIRAKQLGLEHKLGMILVPEIKDTDTDASDKKKSKKKMMPGYILVQLDLDEETWHLVNDTQYVTGFVGNRTNPLPVPEAEVNRIKKQVEEGVVPAAKKVTYEQGMTVRVKEGPFVNFQGIIEEVREDKRKLRVLVTIFGRATPVEVGFDQVEKV